MRSLGLWAGDYTTWECLCLPWRLMWGQETRKGSRSCSDPCLGHGFYWKYLLFWEALFWEPCPCFIFCCLVGPWVLLSLCYAMSGTGLSNLLPLFPLFSYQLYENTRNLWGFEEANRQGSKGLGMFYIGHWVSIHCFQPWRSTFLLSSMCVNLHWFGLSMTPTGRLTQSDIPFWSFVHADSRVSIWGGCLVHGPRQESEQNLLSLFSHLSSHQFLRQASSSPSISITCSMSQYPS